MCNFRNRNRKKGAEIRQFYKIPVDVFQADISPASKMVYTYLLNLANASKQNDKDFVFPSASTIAKSCNFSKSTAKRSLYELKEKGFLEITNRNGTTSEIRINPSQNDTGTGVKMTRPPSQNETTPVSKRDDPLILNRKFNKRDVNNGHKKSFDSDAFKAKAQQPIVYKRKDEEEAELPF